jgi:hypothetical protein
VTRAFVLLLVAFAVCFGIELAWGPVADRFARLALLPGTAWVCVGLILGCVCCAVVFAGLCE